MTMPLPSSSIVPATHPAATERRTRLRLRELCDEISASWRVAAGHDLITDADRHAARALLGHLAPLPRA